MKWASAIYDAEKNGDKEQDLGDIVESLSKSIKEDLDGKSIDLLVGFCLRTF